MFNGGIVVILCLYGDDVARGIDLVVKTGSSFQRTVGIDREEGIIVIPSGQVEGDGVPFRIGGIELACYRADWLILGDGKLGG